MTTLDRIPPHSIEAERGLLGCVLLSPAESVAKVCEVMPGGEQFLYDPRHQTIFDFANVLTYEPEPVDLSKIVVALEGAGQLETVGGYAYLSSLMDSVPSAANLGFYLATVREKWMLRRFIAAGTRIVQQAYENPPVRELADQAEADILAIARGDSAQDRGTYDGAKLAMAAQASAQDRFETAQDHSRRLLTGFACLDRIVRMRPGNLVIVAARPSVGKTSFALNVALNVARAGQPVGILSLEMSPEEIGEQLACTIGQVDSQLLDRGMEEKDFGRFLDGLCEIQGLPLFLECDFGLTIWQVKQRLRVMRQRHGIKLAVVDYLQLVGGDRKRDNRNEEVASVSRGLKALAGELAIPVIALCQLNREIEKGGYRAPRKSDLRESGSIEQDADQVWFLHPKDETPADPLQPTVSVIVDKQRRGATGFAEMVFRKQFTKFEEATYDHHVS